jgi:hypothetical protein
VMMNGAYLKSGIYATYLWDITLEKLATGTADLP